MSGSFAALSGQLTAPTETAEGADERRPVEAGPAEPTSSGRKRRDRARFGARAVVLSGGTYLLLAVLLWWHVWTSHPSSVTTCGCGDSSLFTWFLAWPAYALAHGLNPLYSTALFHSSGINLLSNTAEVGMGVVLAPVTWVFGPVATLNVALTLSPALSAFAMFVLLRRWVGWAPAAFAGGLLYGFSPLLIYALTDAHLMLAAAFVPPLVVACLDEILVRQRHRPVAVGLALAALVTVQFFVGTEVLVIMAITGAMGVALAALFVLVAHRHLAAERVRYAATGLGVAAATSVVLLAYPVWFALYGPSSLGGSIWGSSLLSYEGTNLKAFFRPEAANAVVTRVGQQFGGYQAPTLSRQYIGIGLAAVLTLGLVIWRRDGRLWLFTAIAVISVPLSFGLHLHSWTLWRLLVRLPLLENVIPSRFLLATYLSVAVMLGIIIDHVHTTVLRRGSEEFAASPRTARPRRESWRRLTAGAIATAVAAVALVPILVFDAPGLPLTTTRVVLPQWFRSAAPALPAHQVLLVFPVPFSLQQSAMTWQAVDGMHYAMVGGGGPDALPERAGSERAGQAVIGRFSVSKGPQPVKPGDVVSVRRALEGWGVTMVVVPDSDHLPVYEQLDRVRSTVLLMTVATGQIPVHQFGAWVWTRVDRTGPPLIRSAAILSACGAGPAINSQVSIQQAVRCVVAAPPVTS